MSNWFQVSQHTGSSTDTTYTIVREIVDHGDTTTFNPVFHDPPPFDGRNRSDRRKNGNGRNDPCSCGSGVKFKKCCMLKR